MSLEDARAQDLKNQLKDVEDELRQDSINILSDFLVTLDEKDTILDKIISLFKKIKDFIFFKKKPSNSIYARKNKEPSYRLDSIESEDLLEEDIISYEQIRRELYKTLSKLNMNQNFDRNIVKKFYYLFDLDERYKKNKKLIDSIDKLKKTELKWEECIANIERNAQLNSQKQKFAKQKIKKELFVDKVKQSYQSNRLQR